MPSSNLALAPDVIHLVFEVKPARVLDVGPGRGKYGLLLREYVGTVEWGNGPIVAIDAVEAEASYLSWLLPLEGAVYDRVVWSDVLALEPGSLAGYDVVLLVDVLEHFEHDDGAALLAEIPGRVVICTPAAFFEQDPGPPSERHRSVWTLAELEQTGRLEVGYERLGGIIARLGPAPT